MVRRAAALLPMPRLRQALRRLRGVGSRAFRVRLALRRTGSQRFPVKPQIIEATGRALSKKIFDWLGVAPSYRAVDPMVIGCIKHWKKHQGPLHFFVAWWLDTDTL